MEPSFLGLIYPEGNFPSDTISFLEKVYFRKPLLVFTTAIEQDKVSYIDEVKGALL